jgi:dGTP triphosphohydrolase
MMTQEQFEKFKVHSVEIFNISDLNIIEKTRLLSKTLQNYIVIFIDELNELKEFKCQQERLYGQLYKYYKEDYKVELDSKHEYETYIYADEKYCKLCVEVNKQEIIVKFLEETIDNIKKMSYNIKNWLEIKKYLDGN